jgi:hypothetical protein
VATGTGRLRGLARRLRAAVRAASSPHGAAFDYPYAPRPRFGHGLPAHPGIERLLAADRGRYEDLLDRVAGFATDLGRIPLDPDPGDPDGPHWDNGWFPALDGAVLYGLVASRRPRLYLEIGSGNSTRFAARAVRDHATGTRIVSVDPMPRAGIDALCDRVVRAPLEDLDLGLLSEVSPGDVVFFDGSHRSFQNSDATVFFLEVLPALPSGTVVGVHDVFLPADYPPGWSGRWYNEQYLLAARLLAPDPGLSVLLPAAYVAADPALSGRLRDLWSALGRPGMNHGGAAFWAVVA